METAGGSGEDAPTDERGAESKSDRAGRRFGLATTVAIFSGVAAVASALIAAIALVKADQASTTAENLEAPLLAPAIPFDLRGKTITVATEYASVVKRADFLYWNSTAQRFVVPVENGGGGIAMTVGVPVIVEDCSAEPTLLPRAALGLLGTYSLPSGATDQLGYVHPNRQIYRPGSVTSDGRRLWYSFDYGAFKPRADPLQPELPPAASLLIWYTDGALRKLYSTCVSYLPVTPSVAGVSEWAVLAQRYSSRAWPGGVPR